VQIRPATWDDLERVVDLITAQSRAAMGVAAVRIEHVRGEWELPSFDVGRDNLVAERHRKLVGYAAVGSAQGLSIVADDDAISDELTARIAERARERGLRSLNLAVLSDADPRASLVGRHPFVLQSETVLFRRPTRRRPRGAAAAGRGRGAERSRQRTRRLFTDCSTRRMVHGTGTTRRWCTTSGSGG
jgi:hypothetical protein